MRRVVFSFVAIMLMAVSLQAQESKLSLVIDGGPAFVTGPSTDSDLTPWGIYGGAELMYRINDYWGLVPLSFSYTWFSADKAQYQSHLGGTTTISDASQSMITIVPALQVNTNPENKLMGVFQLGAGWAHTMADLKGVIGGVAGNTVLDESDNSNDFTMFLSGGLEGMVSERVSLLARLKYWVVFNDEEGMPGGGNTNGLNLGVGLRFHY